MKFFVTIIVAMIAFASAFSPRMAPKVNSARLAMKTESNIPKIAIPAAAMSFLAPMAVMAAEGTGKAFGIDDGRLVWAALLPSFIIFPLYLQWSAQQEGEDFFDSYERRRSG